MTERETAIINAKLAERAKRYEDVYEEMKSVALMGVEMTEEEKIFLFHGFRKMIGCRQESCRVLLSIEEEKESKGHQVDVERVRRYIAKVQAEITKICDDFNSILHHHVIPSCSSPKDCAIFYKIIGDSYKYRVGEDRIKAAEQSTIAYQTGTTIAEQGLTCSHPIRLHLAIDLQILYNNVLDLPKTAYDFAKTAIHDVVNNRDNVNMDEDFPKESIDIMQVLVKNQEKLIVRCPEAAEEEYAAYIAGGEGASGGEELGTSNGDGAEVTPAAGTST